MLIGGAGAVLALALAIAVSPLFPVGLAAIAEPSPGVDADWPVLALGMAGVVVAVTCCAAWPAWRAGCSAGRYAGASSPAAAGVSRASGVSGVSVLARGIRSVPVATGIRLSLHRGAGRTAVPVASTITASVVGVIGLTVALVFSASLGSLLGTPRLYGTSWDALVTQLQFGDSLAPAVQAVRTDRRWRSGQGATSRSRCRSTASRSAR